MSQNKNSNIKNIILPYEYPKNVIGQIETLCLV